MSGSGERQASLALRGVRVLVTGTPETSHRLTRLLKAAGASVEEIALVGIGPPPSEDELQSAIDAAASADWIAFTSRAGVDAFARRVRSALPKHVQIAAVGPATAASVREHLQREADLVPARYVAESLASELAARARPGARIVLFAASDARPVLAASLRSRGFNVTAVTAYTTVVRTPPDAAEAIARADAVTLASASAARAIAQALRSSGGPGKTLRGKVVACIGPLTALEARRAEIHVEVTGDDSTTEGLVTALCRYFEPTEPSGQPSGS